MINGEFVTSEATEHIPVLNPVRVLCPSHGWPPPPCRSSHGRSATAGLTDFPSTQATQEVVSLVPHTTAAEMDAAVGAAAAAFPRWRDTSVSARARTMARLADLIRTHTVGCSHG